MTEGLTQAIVNMATFQDLLRIREQRKEIAYQTMIKSRQRIDILASEIIKTQDLKKKAMIDAQEAVNQAYEQLWEKEVSLREIYAVRGLENFKKSQALEYDAKVKDFTAQKKEEEILLKEKQAHFFKCTRREEAMSNVFSENKKQYRSLVEKQDDKDMEEDFEGVLANRKTQAS